MNHCSWIAPDVTLIDGSVVSSNSEAWRFETEARYILNMPNKPIRIATLENIEKKRGLPARQALEDKILEVWTARQAKAS